MSQSNNLNITLSEDVVRFVRDQVSSGEYASESEVIRDSLETMRHIVDEQKRWEQEVLMPAHDRLMANPASALTIEEVERDMESARYQRSRGR